MECFQWYAARKVLFFNAAWLLQHLPLTQGVGVTMSFLWLWRLRRGLWTCLLNQSQEFWRLCLPSSCVVRNFLSSSSAGLFLCNQSTIIDLAKGLQKAKLETLTEAETRTRTTSLLSEIRNIILNYVLRMNYHSGLKAAVIFNSQKCHDQFFCESAY